MLLLSSPRNLLKLISFPSIRTQSMCLLLVWLNPSRTETLRTSDRKTFPIHRYSLIIASNRDEMFARPSLPSKFSTEAKDILAGWDATPGRVGGTWLGLSLEKTKIGALVNIPQRNPTGWRGRGNLVVDFLKTPSVIEDYVKEKGLSGKKGEEYPGFQLITLEGSKSETEELASTTSTIPINWRLHYVSNRCSSFSASNDPQSSDRDVLVFSNSPADAPLMKVVDVEARFRSDVLLAEHQAKQPEEEDAVASQEEEEATLMEALFDILSCRRHYDDRELDLRLVHKLYKGGIDCTDEETLKQMSPVCNKTPVFGTRTQTILLVKWDGNAIWKEKTMREPIDPDDPIWDESTFRVKF